MGTCGEKLRGDTEITRSVYSLNVESIGMLSVGTLPEPRFTRNFILFRQSIRF